MKTITRAKGGAKERKVRVDKIKIPDLWPIYRDLRQSEFTRTEAMMVLETWHLCHDLLRAVKEAP